MKCFKAEPPEFGTVYVAAVDIEAAAKMVPNARLIEELGTIFLESQSEKDRCWKEGRDAALSLLGPYSSRAKKIMALKSPYES